MDLRKLKTLIDLVSESNVSELEITEANGKVRIVKAGAAPVVSARCSASRPSAAAWLQQLRSRPCGRPRGPCRPRPKPAMW